MLCISTHGNSAFRTEELECVFRNFSEKTHNLKKGVILQFKSGKVVLVNCKNLKESKDFFDLVTNNMKEDYKILIK